MKKRILAVAILLIASGPVWAQSVVITPRRTVYRRPKPLHDFKLTFTIRRPIARAATPALSRRITQSISPEKILEFSIREELTEYQWLEEVDYKVLFNRDGVLCVEQWMTGTGAYPDSVTRTVVVDIKTGVRATIESSFRDLAKLATLIRKAQVAEIASATKEMRSDPDARPEELFRETNFTVSDFRDFAVDARGVTFMYDYGFPHVLEALEPAGKFHFTWAELKPFIRTDGLLARFVR